MGRGIYVFYLFIADVCCDGGNDGHVMGADTEKMGKTFYRGIGSQHG